MRARAMIVAGCFVVACMIFSSKEASAQVVSLSPNVTVVYRTTLRAAPARRVARRTITAYSPIVYSPVVYPRTYLYRPYVILPARPVVVYPSYGYGVTYYYRF